MAPWIRRLGVIGLAALAGCGVTPGLGSSGSASPEPPDPPPSSELVASDASVARAFVGAWVRGEATRADPLATAGSQAILFRAPPPDAVPPLVRCGRAISIAAARDCMFELPDGWLVVTALEGSNGWHVIRVKVLP